MTKPVSHEDFIRRLNLQYATMGGYARVAKHGAKDLSESGQKGLMARFYAEVDPEGTLPEKERHMRALAARQLHMRRLRAIRTANQLNARRKADAG